MADVAKRLGVSPATVSLAVNNRPGVNEETKKQVLQCIEEMEAEAAGRRKETGSKENKDTILSAEEKNGISDAFNRMLKVVFINRKKNIIADPGMELWTGITETFDREARKRGMIYSLCYLTVGGRDTDEIVRECNMDIVAGVILFGTEMQEEDMAIAGRIRKPLIVFDYEPEQGDYSSVCIDNDDAVRKAIMMLINQGAKDICYCGCGKKIYNFYTRKKAFEKYRSFFDLPVKSDRYVEWGQTIPETKENAMRWLEQNSLPEAFLFESYMTAIGVMLALESKGIEVPQKVRLAGIDEIPEYMMADMNYSYVRIPNEERAVMGITLLDQFMNGYPDMKASVFLKTEAVENA